MWRDLETTSYPATLAGDQDGRAGIGDLLHDLENFLHRLRLAIQLLPDSVLPSSVRPTDGASSIAAATTFLSWSRSNGLVTYSYAPLRIACTACGIVPKRS